MVTAGDDNYLGEVDSGIKPEIKLSMNWSRETNTLLTSQNNSFTDKQHVIWRIN